MGKTGKNLRWKNEKKLRELTPDVFQSVGNIIDKYRFVSMFLDIESINAKTKISRKEM